MTRGALARRGPRALRTAGSSSGRLSPAPVISKTDVHPFNLEPVGSMSLVVA
jgi:hypothetical protein